MSKTNPKNKQWEYRFLKAFSVKQMILHTHKSRIWPTFSSTTDPELQPFIHNINVIVWLMKSQFHPVCLRNKKGDSQSTGLYYAKELTKG